MVKTRKPIESSGDEDFEIQRPQRKSNPKEVKVKLTRSKSSKNQKNLKLIEESSSLECDSTDESNSNHNNRRKNTRSKLKTKKDCLDSSASSSESHRSCETETKSKKRRRRSSTQTSSDSESDVAPRKKIRRKRKKKNKRKNDVESTPGGRRKIRSILADDQLQKETKDAEKQEEERRQRLKEREDEKIVDIEESDIGLLPIPITKRLVLQKDPMVEVHHDITIHLKPHQVEGIQFIWDNLIETTSQAEKEEGGGCILAHCMGLGKTLQTITVIHTILNCEHLKFRTVLIVAPLNTLLNWIAEFVRWVPNDQLIEIYNLTEYGTRQARRNILVKWQRTGGVMVVGYDLFRLLATGKGIRHKATKVCYSETLLDPGPDIIVCDEGHKLKNSEANISVTMNKVKSRRRLVLTGTPLQNNLIEYQCMVNFVKKNLLGSLKEFRNRFVNPIVNGQHSDSTKRDVRIMKNRCHVLHEMLSGFVQRKDYTALAKYLCDKHEFIVKIRLTPLQVKLYQHYLDTCTNRGSNPNAVVASSKDTGLFADYQNLMRVWTHPRILRLHTRRKEIENERNFVDDSDEASMTEEESSSDDDKNKKNKSEKKETELSTVNGDDSNNDETDDDVIQSGKRKSRRLKDSDEDSYLSGGDNVDSSSDAGSEEEEINREPRRRRKCGRYKLRGQSESPVKKIRSRLAEDDNSDNSNSDCQVELNGLDSFYDDSATWYAGLLNQQTDAYKKFDVSGKVMILFEILRMARECNDKVLVFSQSLLSLDLIEEMLALSTTIAAAMETGDCDVPDAGGDLPPGFHQTWYKNVDYFRMDGSSLGKSRQRWINEFNDVSDERARLFLISTRAGSLGVNLVAANRVVIFDVSWNPSHDIQSIFRVYRFGQTKTCFIYRLISQGTMEEKIYDRQVTKQSLSFRVVDEQQINRHFTAHDLQELYSFNPDPLPETLPVHALPKDQLLAEILVGETTKNLVVSFHSHDSLLDHQETEELTEEERKAAWEEYENEKKGIRMSTSKFAGLPQIPGLPLQLPATWSHNIGLISAGDFQRQQVLRKLLIFQQQRMANGGFTVDDVTNVLLPCVDVLPPDKQRTAKSYLSFMIKASSAIEEARKKIDSNKSVDIENMVKALKPLPMYRHMTDDSIRMLSIEVQIRQQQVRLTAEKEMNGNLTQLRWFREKFMKLFYDATDTSSADNVTKPSEVNLFNASTFARNVFAQMVSSHGAATGFSGESSKQSSPTPVKKTEGTSSIPVTQSLPAQKAHVANTDRFKFGIIDSIQALKHIQKRKSPLDGAKTSSSDVKQSLPGNRLVVALDRLHSDTLQQARFGTDQSDSDKKENSRRKESVVVVSSDDESNNDDVQETRDFKKSRSRRRPAL